MSYYCEKCGQISLLNNKICVICQSVNSFKPIPNEYLDGCTINDNLKEEFIEKVVKISPNFDTYWFEHKEDVIECNKKQYEKMKAFQKEQSDVLKCPTCQSTNIRKMGGVERGISIYAFGIFSKKINKTFKCQNCGYTW